MAEICKSGKVTVVTKNLPTPANTPTPIISGAGVPNASIGQDGFFYFNSTNGDFYRKESGAWVLLLNIVGPQGDTGESGADGSDGQDGSNGLGWTGASYNASNGIVTFTSDDGLQFTTGDIRGTDGAKGDKGDAGADGQDGQDGSDGADGQNGTDGQGWTGGSYDGNTGIVTFTSDDGLGFSTDDLRGADGAGAEITVADTDSVDLTLDSGEISADAIPAGIDHDQLLNYQANQHIDWTDAESDLETAGVAKLSAFNDATAADTGTPSVLELMSASGTKDSPSRTGGRDSGSTFTGEVQFTGYDQSGPVSGPAAKLVFRAGGTSGNGEWSAATRSSQIELWNTPVNSTTLTKRFEIRPNGDVLFNGGAFNIPASGALSLSQDITTSSGKGLKYVFSGIPNGYFPTDGGVVNGYAVHRNNVQILIDADDSSTDAYFAVDANRTTPTTSGYLFKVVEDGNVGINEDAPSEKLHVNGNVYIENGHLRMDSATKQWEITVDDLGVISASEVV